MNEIKKRINNIYVIMCNIKLCIILVSSKISYIAIVAVRRLTIAVYFSNVVM